MARGIRGDGGGIVGLYRFLGGHGEATRRDLLVAGLRLDDLGTPALTWVDLRAFVNWAPRDSAIGRSTAGPDPDLTAEVVLLREIEHGIRVLAWQRTEAASKRDRTHYPARVPITDAEMAEHRLAAPSTRTDGTVETAPPLDDVRQWLGWENHN